VKFIISWQVPPLTVSMLVPTAVLSTRWYKELWGEGKEEGKEEEGEEGRGW
jgi:predicted transposase YdaD